MTKSYFNRKRQLKIDELYKAVLKGKNIDRHLEEIERLVHQDGENVITAEMWETFTAKEPDEPRYYDTRAMKKLAKILMIDFINKGKENPAWKIPLEHECALELLAEISGEGVDIEIILKQLLENFINLIKGSRNYSFYDKFISILNFLIIDLRLAKPKKHLDYIRIVYEKMKRLNKKTKNNYAREILADIDKFCEKELKL
ncbi:hypothetical protein HOG48_03430 [Candidatus Peregrinibacteria bacterium]|nr:hypothetical protein [Candidatus Peregrinibacteria bacterium]